LFVGNITEKVPKTVIAVVIKLSNRRAVALSLISFP